MAILSINLLHGPENSNPEKILTYRGAMRSRSVIEGNCEAMTGVVRWLSSSGGDVIITVSAVMRRLSFSDQFDCKEMLRASISRGWGLPVEMMPPLQRKTPIEEVSSISQAKSWGIFALEAIILKPASVSVCPWRIVR